MCAEYVLDGDSGSGTGFYGKALLKHKDLILHPSAHIKARSGGMPQSWAEEAEKKVCLWDLLAS